MGAPLLNLLWSLTKNDINDIISSRKTAGCFLRVSGDIL
jgi:hypothetical protein